MSVDDPSIGNGIDASCSEDAEVARILDEYLAGLEAGRPADPERLLAEHPAIASQLRGCLEVMHLAGRVAEVVEAAPVVEGEAGAPSGPRLDDYRIIRQIGRGGMGVVYEAEQQSLRRRVALKVLPMASALDPRQLRRFHVEAQAAAQLHHTHIVPVYAVGCERGVHYYAMQYIEGQTLAEVVRELRQLEGRGAADEAPTVVMGGDHELATLLASGRLAPSEKPAAPEASAGSLSAGSPARAGWHAASSSSRRSVYFRTVASLGVQAAEALEHAHQEGVVHRDIKPANVMVDVKGHLWITDFGLARLQNDPGLTMSGDLVGTIRYMSPEQAIGRRAAVDPRADIYALGVTLYELVALEPAFDGTDRREVLRQIIEEGPRPLQALNPAVPLELETIVLKAMAREPESRYPTAQELADDLQRFLEHRPIRARRPTFLDRVAKWSRRHRAVVGSAVLMLILTSVGLAISTATIAAKQAELARQRERADLHLGNMLSGVGRFVVVLRDRRLSATPELIAFRRELSDKAAEMIRGFIDRRDSTPVRRMEAAHAYLRLAEIAAMNDRLSEALENYHQAEAITQALAEEFPSEAIYQYQLGQARNFIGILLWETGQAQAAAGPLRAADRAYRRGIALDPRSPLLLNVLAWHLATCPDPSLRDLAQAIELARGAIAMDPDRASIWNTLGVASYRAGRWHDAIRALETACRLRDDGEADDLFVLSMSHWQMGNRPRARELFRRARERFERELPPLRQAGTFHAEAAALIEPPASALPEVRLSELPDPS